MSRVLVTGGAGFIGSHVVDALVAKGHVVHVLDDFSGGDRRNIQNIPEITVTKGSIALPDIAHFCTEHADFVIHCAAFAAENLSNNTRVFTIENNLVGEAVIRNACIRNKVQGMISLSSIAVMGHSAGMCYEVDQPKPIDVYGVAKYAGELDAAVARHHHGLDYIVFRPHNVVGVRQNLCDRYRNVASIFIRQALEGKPMTIFGNGKQIRQFSPVSYVAAVIASGIDRKDCWNKTFNLGADEIMTVSALAKMISKLAGVEEKIEYLPFRREATHATMNHGLVQSTFADIKQTETLEEVFVAMIADAKEKGLGEMQKGPQIELEEGLPESWKL